MGRPHKEIRPNWKCSCGSLQHAGVSAVGVAGLAVCDGEP